ncbi:MAG: IS110 family transposase [Chloroflexota bacterium]|nr:IS110 family transposase [Chloroflexota bacterium]
MEDCTAGLDWASEAHAICIVDARGEIRESFSVAHDAAGLAELVRRLGRYPGVRLAIERPEGLLVDTLVDAGIRVVPIHPNKLKAARERYSSSGAKSDPGDAYVLADFLRTDGHRFRELAPLSEATRALRALVRSRDDLVKAKVALTNQLAAQLAVFWPGAAEIFQRLDSDIALAFLTRYPTPETAAHLGEARLRAFLRRNAYCGRRPAADLLGRLRAAPSGLAGALESEARGECVKALVRALSTVLPQIRELEGAIAVALDEHPDGALLKSFPRAGEVNAAQLLAEIGDVRGRYLSDDVLAMEAGVVPVTKRSGKAKSVGFRWACNKRLRRALTGWADNSRRASPWAEDLYRRARARGADHPHATRILARAWLRVLWRCWQDHALYDPARHLGAARLAA